MAVLVGVEGGGTLRQDFGPAVSTVAPKEPLMWATNQKAYWAVFPGGERYDHFHPGQDWSAPIGTPVLAMEAGVVTFAGYWDSIAGIKVEVEIRPGTKFSFNHLEAFVPVKIGDKVKKGQKLGTIGMTGVTTGPHTHSGISIQERGPDGVTRTMLYDAKLFQQGGPLADDPRIQPLLQKVQINKSDVPVTIWKGYPEFDDSDIFGTARSTGIYRAGRRVSGIQYAFNFIRWHDTKNHGTYALVTGYGKRLAIARRHIHFL